MKRTTTASRLKTLMEERNLRQVDILKLAEPYCREYNQKLSKSDLSQYISGKVEPHQGKLYILGKALNVNEAWLMGFDVDRHRQDAPPSIRHELTPERFEQTHKEYILSNDEVSLIDRYRYLDDFGKDMVDSVLDKEYDRCKDEEENSVTIDRETAMKMPLELRLKFGKFLTEGTELMVARRKKK